MKRTRYTPPEKPHELDTLKLLTTPEQFEVITDAMIGETVQRFVEGRRAPGHAELKGSDHE